MRSVRKKVKKYVVPLQFLGGDFLKRLRVFAAISSSPSPSSSSFVLSEIRSRFGLPTGMSSSCFASPSTFVLNLLRMAAVGDESTNFSLRLLKVVSSSSESSMTTFRF